MSPTKENSGWSAERRAAHSAMMRRRNADPAFALRRDNAEWSPERRARHAQLMATMNSDPEFQARRLAGIATRPPRGVRLPDHAHPLVRGFFLEFNAQQATRNGVAARSGLSRGSFTGWRNRNMPMLDAFDAALNALDLELAIVPIGTRDANGFAKRTGGSK